MQKEQLTNRKEQRTQGMELGKGMVVTHQVIAPVHQSVRRECPDTGLEPVALLLGQFLIDDSAAANR